MRTRKQIDTTLGELIVAVSEAVSPLTHNRTNANILVSYILSDLVASRRVRLKKDSILKLA
jgi:hypothetical protein